MKPHPSGKSTRNAAGAFEDFVKKILRVPKAELDQKEAEYKLSRKKTRKTK